MGHRKGWLSRVFSCWVSREFAWILYWVTEEKWGCKTLLNHIVQIEFSLENLWWRKLCFCQTSKTNLFAFLLLISWFSVFILKLAWDTQSNLRPNTLSSIGLEEIISYIGLKFLQAEHVGLVWKNNETQPNPANEYPCL